MNRFAYSATVVAGLALVAMLNAMNLATQPTLISDAEQNLLFGGYSSPQCVFGSQNCYACMSQCSYQTLSGQSDPVCVNGAQIPGCGTNSNFVGTCVNQYGGTGCAPFTACGGAMWAHANQCGTPILHSDGTIESCTNAPCVPGGSSTCLSCT